jgi:hypothetical protein
MIYRIQAHEIMEELPEELTSGNMYMAANNDDEHTKI